VARARVHFRAEGGPVWSYVEMKVRDGVFYGTLPKPRKSTKKIHECDAEHDLFLDLQQSASGVNRR